MESSEHPDTMTYVFYTSSLEAIDNLEVAWLTPHLSTEFLWRTEICTGYLAHMLISFQEKEEEEERERNKRKEKKGCNQTQEDVAAQTAVSCRIDMDAFGPSQVLVVDLPQA